MHIKRSHLRCSTANNIKNKKNTYCSMVWVPRRSQKQTKPARLTASCKNYNYRYYTIVYFCTLRETVTSAGAAALAGSSAADASAAAASSTGRHCSVCHVALAPGEERFCQFSQQV